LRKIGEDVTETLELVPRQWKVVQHVREKFSCRSCEAITQPLAKVTTPPGFPRILGPGESYQVGPNKGPDPHRQTARQSNLPAFSRSAMFCAAAFEQPRGARVLGGRGAITSRHSCRGGLPQLFGPDERSSLVSFTRQFVRFVVARRKYWLVRVFALLLMVGSVLVFSKGSVVAPLIYTIF